MYSIVETITVIEFGVNDRGSIMAQAVVGRITKYGWIAKKFEE